MGDRVGVVAAAGEMWEAARGEHNSWLRCCDGRRLLVGREYYFIYGTEEGRRNIL